MALISCPECGKRISDKAYSCPECGYPLKKGGMPEGYTPLGYGGYEYKSKKTVFGMPLVHIVYGPAGGGGFKPARGFIAIGNIAIGVFALGGFAVGIFTLAGIGLGLICFAGIALGSGLGIGGIATGYIAVGGLAIGVYAVGGRAVGSHTLLNDPSLREFLESIFKR